MKDILHEAGIRLKQRELDVKLLDKICEDIENVQTRLLGTGLEEDEREELNRRKKDLLDQVRRANKNEHGHDGFERHRRKMGLHERPAAARLPAEPLTTSLLTDGEEQP